MAGALIKLWLYSRFILTREDAIISYCGLTADNSVIFNISASIADTLIAWISKVDMKIDTV